MAASRDLCLERNHTRRRHPHVRVHLLVQVRSGDHRRGGHSRRGALGLGRAGAPVPLLLAPLAVGCGRALLRLGLRGLLGLLLPLPLLRLAPRLLLLLAPLLRRLLLLPLPALRLLLAVASPLLLPLLLLGLPAMRDDASSDGGAQCVSGTLKRRVTSCEVPG